MCGGGVRSILFLPLVARCLEQAVQLYYFFLFFLSHPTFSSKILLYPIFLVSHMLFQNSVNIFP